MSYQGMFPVTIDTVVADGGVILKNPSPYGGTWAFALVSGGEVVHKRSGYVMPTDAQSAVFLDQAAAPWWNVENVQGPEVTNNLTEFVALLAGMEALPDGWSGRVMSDSQITLLRFFRYGALVGIPQEHRTRLQTLQKRLAWKDIKWTLLDGHPTKAQLEKGIGKRGNPCSPFNVLCDKLCGERADAYKKWLASRKEGGAQVEAAPEAESCAC